MSGNKNNSEIKAGEVSEQAAETNEHVSAPSVQEDPAHYRVTYCYGLNLREGPDKHSKVLKILPCGTEVIAAGDSLPIGATNWLPVEGGWVDAAYLTVVSEEN